jgi:hypothetical protein
MEDYIMHNIILTRIETEIMTNIAEVLPRIFFIAVDGTYREYSYYETKIETEQDTDLEITTYALYIYKECYCNYEPDVSEFSSDSIIAILENKHGTFVKPEYHETASLIARQKYEDSKAAIKQQQDFELFNKLKEKYGFK